MADDQHTINELRRKLAELSRKQEAFGNEIARLRAEIARLSPATNDVVPQEEEVPVEASVPPPLPESMRQPDERPLTAGQRFARRPLSSGRPQRSRLDIETFVGENLISKLGILVLLIGIGIGVKYSIDNNLISPLMRIVLGYVAGAGLLGVGWKLKEKYEQFSAVLVSGAFAAMYFITYFAYTLYDLFPQTIAFALMIAFTVATVGMALAYDRQVIAYIGLVGAYAIPFLLSEGSDRPDILFAYMAILNVGILVLSFKKAWKALYYTAFGFTWAIYALWHVSGYRQHFGVALLFLLIFFGLFYAMFLAYKLIQKETLVRDDLPVLLTNAGLYFILSYITIDGHTSYTHLVGLFTLGNALVHFGVAALIYYRRPDDRKLFYFLSGLGLVFVTIAIPVQFDGNIVTLLWAAQAALLFWIGRTKDVPVYEKLSYPLMLLAFIAMLDDWSLNYGGYVMSHPGSEVTPFFNVHLLTSLLFVAAFGFILLVNRDEKYPSALGKGLIGFATFCIATVFIFSLYYAFALELLDFWNHLYMNSEMEVVGEGGYSTVIHNRDLLVSKQVWIVMYNLFFAAGLLLVNMKWVQNRTLGLTALGLNVVAIALFLTLGLFSLSELRSSYLGDGYAQYFTTGYLTVSMRYVAYLFVALSLVACYRYLRTIEIRRDSRMFFELGLHLVILWIASSELIHCMDMLGSMQSYKLGLSILWGIYALLLIALGIWKRRSHIRIAAIILFGVTLVKLFLYDIAHLDTIARTVVFVSLGVLLLLVSFLYNKYKHLITENHDESAGENSEAEGE